jgi:uncharacterized protein GlcG (DUF336 family)
MSEAPQLFHGMIGIEGLIAFAGGAPSRSDGQMIDAVAESGGTSARMNKLRKGRPL